MKMMIPPKQLLSFMTSKNAKHHFFITSIFHYFFLMLSIYVSFRIFYDLVFVKQLSKDFTKFHCKNVCVMSE